MQLKRAKFNLVELSTPMLMWLWAMWFAMFDIAGKTATFDKMKGFSSYAWAFLFAAVALLKAYSIVFSNYRLRRASAFISVWLWLTMTTFFAFGNYQSHLVPASFFFAYQSFLSWHRIRIDKKL